MELQGPLVFVVDDRTVIAETLAMVLVQAGFKAIAFDDPTTALSAASIKHPDVLISDVIMPRMTDIELAIRVRSAHPGCRVLLYSDQIHTAILLERAKKGGTRIRDFRQACTSRSNPGKAPGFDQHKCSAQEFLSRCLNHT